MFGSVTYIYFEISILIQSNSGSQKLLLGKFSQSYPKSPSLGKWAPECQALIAWQSFRFEGKIKSFTGKQRLRVQNHEISFTTIVKGNSQSRRVYNQKYEKYEMKSFIVKVKYKVKVVRKKKKEKKKKKKG